MRPNILQTATEWLLVMTATLSFLAGNAVAQDWTPGPHPETQPPRPQVDTDFILYWDGERTVKLSARKHIAAAQEIQAEPIFENAPFLRLKPGDKLYTGQQANPSGKRGKFGLPAYDQYYLAAGGQYFELGLLQKNRKLNLEDAPLSLLFDWNLSLETAGQLYKIHMPYRDQAISPAAYDAMKSAVQQKFPDLACANTEIIVRQPFLAATGDTRYAVIEGLGFENFSDIIYQYRLHIGPQVFQEYRKTLIVGPPHVERWEFEGRDDRRINSAPPYHPDAQTAATKRAAYQRMQAFQSLVEKFLPPPKFTGF